MPKKPVEKVMKAKDKRITGADIISSIINEDPVLREAAVKYGVGYEVEEGE